MSWTAPLTAMFRAGHGRRDDQSEPGKYAHYLLQEAHGLLAPHELQTWRLLYGPPMPYTRERFADTHVDAGLSWVSRPRRHL